MSREDVRKGQVINLYIPLVIIFIISDIICDNYILSMFGKETVFRETALFIGLSLLQIIVSPIQAGLSDIYGRKKSLLFSLTISLLSLCLVLLYSSKILPFFSILILINFAKGCFGNTIPIAWAAVGDIKSKDLRFSYALSTAGYAFGYLILIFINSFLNPSQSILLLIAFMIPVIFLCGKVFVDLKDSSCQAMNKSESSIIKFAIREFSLVAHDLKNRALRWILIASCFWEISLYSILILYADFLSNQSYLVGGSMMLGYLIGTLFVKFCSKIDNYSMIRYGYAISVLSLIPYFILIIFIEKKDYLLSFCYFFHSIGNALLSPTLLSLITREKSVHQRGKICGLAESTDTIAFLAASITIMIYKYFQFNFFYLVCFSFLSVAISWLPYHKYEKLCKINNLP